MNWFQYKICKQLEELEVENSLCLGYKPLEYCAKFKKPSNIGMQELDKQIKLKILDIDLEKQKRIAKHMEELDRQKTMQMAHDICNLNKLKKIVQKDFSLECKDNIPKQSQEKPLNNPFNTQNEIPLNSCSVLTRY